MEETADVLGVQGAEAGEDRVVTSGEMGSIKDPVEPAEVLLLLRI